MYRQSYHRNAPDIHSVLPRGLRRQGALRLINPDTYICMVGASPNYCESQLKSSVVSIIT